MLDNQELRKWAEKKSAMVPEKTGSLSPEENKQLLHELQVHQIELEMQNEELRRSQAELEALHASYFDLYELAPVGYCTLSGQGLIRQINLTLATMLGIPRSDLLSQPLSRYIHPDDQDTYYRIRKGLTGQGETWVCELRLLPAKGDCLWAYLQSISSQADECRVAVSDISKRKKDELLLQESKEKIEQIMNSTGEGIFGLDAMGICIFCNAAAIKLLGYRSEGDLIGKKMHALVHHSKADGTPNPESDCMACNSLCTGEIKYSDHDLLWRGDGSCFHTEAWAHPIRKDEVVQGTVVSFVDRSEHVKLESQLRQTQKMEAIGTLAGGIAHDFNNILTAILGYGEMVMLQLPPDSPLREQQAQVVKAGERARELVKQILSFSRRTEQKLQPLLVQYIVKEALKLLRASLPSTIQIQENVDVGCGPVLADPSQIHQVIMNLCTNAFQAMLVRGGVMKVALTPVAYAEIDLAERGKLLPGPYLELLVSDTGCGMSEGVRERVFEPFFTTKITGQGTGLGLSVVHGIVTDLGGVVRVDSMPGCGASFRVYLPLVEKGGPEVSPKVDKEVSRGRETVLVLDDEEEIVLLQKSVLEKLGYRVLPYTDSSVALAAFKSAPADFDLIVTDMTMPNLTGAELVPEVLRARPGMPIILCTGFSELIDEEKAKALGVREFRIKPVKNDELAEVVRKVLDQAK